MSTEIPAARPAPSPEEGRNRLAMKLFLLSLGMLFAASMIGYTVIRLRTTADVWISTAVILISSFAIQGALSAVREGRTVVFRRALLAGFALSLVFLAVQAPALVQVLRDHAALRAREVYLYALIFFLILLHAAHVVGGLVPLGIVTVRAQRNPAAYTAQRHGPVQAVTMYWHFLDGVWFVMFLLLLLLG
jgi:heme/copper-type cytochrome/quinol oxidase subunit 3